MSLGRLGLQLLKLRHSSGSTLKSCRHTANQCSWLFEPNLLSHRTTSLMVSRSFSSWPRLESATGRARKRRRRTARIKARADSEQQPLSFRNVGESQQDQRPPHRRKGYPWEVLFPDPYNNPVGQAPEKSTRKKLSLRQRREVFRQAWAMYKETWQGFSDESQRNNQEGVDSTEKDQNSGTGVDEEVDNASKRKDNTMKSNVERNLEFTRREGKAFLEEAKKQTGIKNSDDLKAFAAEQMKLANTCLKEFMAGYRQGRDEEIDRMLHEYFQDGDSQKGKGSNDDSIGGKSSGKKKRKPKRRIVQD